MKGGVGERSRRQWRDLEMDWLWRLGDAVKGDAFSVWPGWTAVPSLWPEESGAQADAVHFRTPPRGELWNRRWPCFLSFLYSSFPQLVP